MTVLKRMGAYGDRPCIVLYREVPNEPENCLIVESGQLDPRTHDDLMMFVQSAEGQEANDISQVLARKTFTDGNNALNSLHNNKQIKKVPVAQVVLKPTPTQTIMLSEVNAEIRKIESRSENHKTNRILPEDQQTRVTTADIEGTTANQEVETIDDSNIAEGLLVQAQLMKEDAEAMLADAEAKINQAYELNPELVPKKGPGRPKKTTLS